MLWSRLIRLVVGLVIIVAGYELEVSRVVCSVRPRSCLRAQTIYLVGSRRCGPTCWSIRSTIGSQRG